MYYTLFKRKRRKLGVTILKLHDDDIPKLENKQMDEPIFESSGNVFEDLDLEPAEAAILHMRAKLMIDLRLYIQSSGMTQTEAAKKLGIAQSRVSDLVRGKWEKFSLEMLITLEARAGRQVTLELAV